MCRWGVCGTCCRQRRRDVFFACAGQSGRVIQTDKLVGERAAIGSGFARFSGATVSHYSSRTAVSSRSGHVLLLSVCTRDSVLNGASMVFLNVSKFDESAWMCVTPFQRNFLLDSSRLVSTGEIWVMYAYIP